jgi:hypothetical protein
MAKSMVDVNVAFNNERFHNQESFIPLYQIPNSPKLLASEQSIVPENFLVSSSGFKT